MTEIKFDDFPEIKRRSSNIDYANYVIGLYENDSTVSSTIVHEAFARVSHDKRISVNNKNKLLRKLKIYATN